MNRRERPAVIILSAAFIFASGSAVAEGTDAFRWSTGLEYSSGTYGGSDEIEDLYVPLIARVDSTRWSFELVVPYLSVRAPAGTTVTDPGNEPISGSGPVTTESGLGDVSAGITLYDALYSGEHNIALDITGKIKFGTADESKGLGTGEQDLTLRTDLYKFFDEFTLMGSAGYRWRGDTADLDLENVLLGSVGWAYRISDESRLGLIYDYRESALAGGDAVSELSGFVSSRVTDSLRLQFYAFTGFSDSSPDWGAGILLEII